jgi:hypothetical protein
VAEAGQVRRLGGSLLTLDLLHPFSSGPLRRMRFHGAYAYPQLVAALSRAGFGRWRHRRGVASYTAVAATRGDT